MAEFVLKNKYFEFNEKLCKQISGITTGTEFAPTSFHISFATQQLQPFIWLRYIDDIFFIWAHDEEQLNLFLKDLNEFHPNFKFTYETSQNRVNFLDLNVSLKGGAIFTAPHIKPTDSYQSLHYKSSHPCHIENSIPYSQALRIQGRNSPKNIEGANKKCPPPRLGNVKNFEKLGLSNVL